MLCEHVVYVVRPHVLRYVILRGRTARRRGFEVGEGLIGEETGWEHAIGSPWSGVGRYAKHRRSAARRGRSLERVAATSRLVCRYRQVLLGPSRVLGIRLESVFAGVFQFGLRGRSFLSGGLHRIARERVARAVCAGRQFRLGKRSRPLGLPGRRGGLRPLRSHYIRRDRGGHRRGVPGRRRRCLRRGV